MNDRHRSPDARELSGRELPEADFPAARGDFRVYFDPEAHERIWAHAEKDKSVELGGVLVGAWQRDKDGPFVAVRHVICSQLAASGTGEVTFTHDAWAEIHREMDAKHAGLAIVGWYHTHPDFGIFLSDRDRFIHEHFFTEPGQIAFVVDPIRKLEGVFAWRNGKTARCPHYWIGKRVQSAPREADGDQAPPPQSDPRSAEAACGRSGPSRADWLTWVLGGTLLFLVAYLLADLRHSWDRARLVDGVIAHFGTMKVLRPGLRENLELVEKEVGVIEKELAALRPKEDGGKTGARADWARLQDRLRVVKAALGQIREVYGLDDLESAILARRLAESFADMRGGVPIGGRETAPGAGPPEAGRGAESRASSPPAAPPAAPPAETPAKTQRPSGQAGQEPHDTPEVQDHP